MGECTVIIDSTTVSVVGPSGTGSSRWALLVNGDEVDGSYEEGDLHLRGTLPDDSSVEAQVRHREDGPTQVAISHDGLEIELFAVSPTGQR